MDKNKFFEPYLDRLTNYYSITDSKFHQLKLIDEFIVDDDSREVLNISPSFFKAVKRSFWKDVIITLFNLYDIGSQAKRTIPHFLKRFYQEFNELDIKDEEFKRDEVLEIQKIIKTISPELKQIKTYRDKLYSHFDKKYFDQPILISQDAEVNHKVIDKVLEKTESILFKIHAGYRDVHYEMKIRNRGDVKKIVNNLKTFKKWRNNEEVRNLLNQGKIGYS